VGCGEQWSRNVRPPGRNPFLVENGLHLRYADKLRMDRPSLLLHTRETNSFPAGEVRIGI